ncbi:TetR/AcrR family transcriptional regulator [Solihabitans fulvus]|uniref:TetR/AcrR family transcriptional regulator n=1 Tax=Solihabitans fulvus TaxID=1892852 RepID=A0A5B2W850_9PSEU|nr:TetR/AcrR family transcriptional regulator [Solihabitans fulvus]KAA2246766.1 TetR/AcrR family transcriptional regulator [Solihabitans fulvus]
MDAAEPGFTRPGGRTARTRAAVLDATYAELVARGYAGLTVENVADRSGVHKTTVYRRWGSVDGLVADALSLAADTFWPIPDTGSIEQDLLAVAREVVVGFTDPELRAAPAAVIAASFQSPRAATALHEFLVARQEQAAVVVTRAVDRGEIPAGVDGVEAIRVLCAPLYYRLFITREPVDDGTAVRAAAVALAALRAGAV